ncbi:hypothetical protein SLI_4893 [Streptomyces lividans 1326]|uniref:Uncharacterized protein n=1 Tax=Streptomyces lividans 1326 TaxID=1200984 RepID=A0A7U9HEC1_STRLI|nr:hypothetical protein SLI_4893 [Streptomyces lividans 1326]
MLAGLARCGCFLVLDATGAWCHVQWTLPYWSTPGEGHQFPAARRGACGPYG